MSCVQWEGVSVKSQFQSTITILFITNLVDPDTDTVCDLICLYRCVTDGLQPTLDFSRKDQAYLFYGCIFLCYKIYERIKKNYHFHEFIKMLFF